MIYENIDQLFKLLKQNNLWAEKKLGQNFLINKKTLNQITESANITNQDTILEIGPGLGILTEQLINKAKKVQSIELDDKLIPYLEKQFGANKNWELTHADALKTPAPNEPFKLVANIPYYITSPILNHYLNPKDQNQQRPQIIVLLVQKEVAEKICVKEGDHTVLSLEVQIFGKPEIVASVPANSFYPAPKVDSAVLKITTYETPLVKNIPLFFKTIKAAFLQRRKTLSNSLRSSFPISKEQIEEMLTNCHLKSMIRPQELKIEDWNNLIEEIKKNTPQQNN